MTPYEIPETSFQIELDLSRNEGTPWFLDSAGPIENITEMTNRYPRTAGLRSAIAERHGVSEHQILVTAGGDDALLRCFLARAGRTFVTTNPTFEMIRRYAEQSGSIATEIPWWDGPLPIDDFARASAESAFCVVVSPNNPTGQAITSGDLRRLAASSPLVVLDAAYVEFSDEDLTPLALELGNVVVIRTMSKAFGLAGLRVGYLIGPEQLVDEISAFGSPYPVSGISAHLAEQAMRSESGSEKSFVDEVRVERRQLQELVEKLGLSALSSQANFLLVMTRNPGWLIRATGSLGVGLRWFPGQDALGNSVRISLPGRPSEFERLSHALTTAIAPECLLFALDTVVDHVKRSDRETLGLWKARFPLGIVTGRSRLDAQEVLARFGFEEFFDTVVTRDDAPTTPNPAPVLKALANLGLKHGWLVGSSSDDITAARQARLLPIALSTQDTNESGAVGALDDAALVFETTRQLQEILNDTQF